MQHLTTGRAAKLLRVSPRVVQKWMDRGLLPCERLPESNHRRVLLDDFLAFVDKHGLHVDRESLYRLARG